MMYATQDKQNNWISLANEMAYYKISCILLIE